MKPQNFVKEFNRMCWQYRHQGMDDDCSSDCPMYDNGCWQGTVLDTRHPEKFTETYDIVAKWSDMHPAETRQDRFLKLFPSAKMTDFWEEETGAKEIIDICPNLIDKNQVNARDCENNSCRICRGDYWLAPADEDESEN